MLQVNEHHSSLRNNFYTIGIIFVSFDEPIQYLRDAHLPEVLKNIMTKIKQTIMLPLQRAALMLYQTISSAC